MLGGVVGLEHSGNRGGEDSLSVVLEKKDTVRKMDDFYLGPV